MFDLLNKKKYRETELGDLRIFLKKPKFMGSGEKILVLGAGIFLNILDAGGICTFHTHILLGQHSGEELYCKLLGEACKNIIHA